MPGQQRRERKLRSFLGARFWHTAPCACIVTPAGRTGSRHFLTRDERSALPAAAAGCCTPRRMSSIACWQGAGPAVGTLASLSLRYSLAYDAPLVRDVLHLFALSVDYA